MGPLPASGSHRFTLDLEQTSSRLTVRSSVGPPVTIEASPARGTEPIRIITRAHCYRGVPNKASLLLDDVEIKARAFRFERY